MAIKNVRSEIPQDLTQKRTSPFSFESIDEEFPSKVKLPYNPESVQVGIAPNWQSLNSVGAVKDRSTWTNNAPKTFTWNHIIQVKDIYIDIGTELIVNRDKYYQVQDILNAFEDWAKTPTSKTQEPTRLLFTRGEAGSTVVVISAFSYKELNKGPDGVILTAEYDITLTEREEENGEF